MKFTRTIAFLLCVLFCLGSVSVYASTEDALLPADTSQIPQMLRYSNIDNIMACLDIKSDGAVIADCYVYARNCTSVRQEVKLQYWMNNTWNDVYGASWAETDTGTVGHIEDVGSIKVGSGSYRLMDKITVYSGTTIVEQVEFPGSVINR